MKNLSLVHKVVRFVILLLFFAVNVSAQQTIIKSDSIAEKLDFFGLKNQSPILFIHFDKTVYTNNENVWFTGYFLNTVNRASHKTLSLFLVKDDERAIVLDGKFVISDGLVFGNILIPDSVASGSYTFIAYTNHQINGQPDVVFKQRITIKNTDQPTYAASLNPLDTSANIGMQKIMLTVNFVNPAKRPDIIKASYYVGNSEHPVLKGDINIRNGLYQFDIPSRHLSYGNNRLHVKLWHLKENKEITIDLPAITKPAIVGIYPEGGNLVAGVNNTVGWEVKGAGGSPLAVDATLYDGAKAITKITTNSYGFGRFVLTPKPGAGYFIKLNNVNQKDTLYALPKILGGIPSLNIERAIANNVLTVNLRGADQQQINLIVHNYKTLFLDTKVVLTGKNKQVHLLLDSLPKGLAVLTLTDQQGRPIAERVFFAHHDRKSAVQIKTNAQNYNTRQKVTLKLKLAPGQFPDSGLVSIACTQENRLEIKNKNDIESFAYLKNYLGDLPVKESYLGATEADKQFLENILLIKSWRRYTWLDVLKTNAADTVFTRSDLIFSGSLTKEGDPIKTQKTVINFYKQSKFIVTDKKGQFVLSDDDMVIKLGGKMFLTVADDPQFTYEVHINDPYNAANVKLAQRLQITDLNIPQQPTSTMSLLKGFERSIQLKEVKINASNDRFIYGANACGDYVCRNNVFNCRNHVAEFDNFAPVIGNTYIESNGPYQGCDGTLNGRIYKKGIYAAQEFYPSDLSDPTGPPEYISTIYWKYLAKINTESEAKFSFYTNDISGRFKVIVQGCSTNDVIYGEHTFNVVKPN